MGLWEHSDCYIRAWGWGEPRGLGFRPGPSKSSYSHRHVRTPAADKHSCMPFPGLEWASPSHCHHHTLPMPFSSHLLREDLPEAPPFSSHPAPKVVKIMLPSGVGVGTGGVWFESAWGMWQGTRVQVLSTRPAVVHSVHQCLFHEALEGRTGAPRLRTYEVKNDPSVSLTQRPRADQHGSCHEKDGRRPHGHLQEPLLLGRGCPSHFLLCVSTLNRHSLEAGSSFHVSSPNSEANGHSSMAVSVCPVPGPASLC